MYNPLMIVSDAAHDKKVLYNNRVFLSWESLLTRGSGIGYKKITKLSEIDDALSFPFGIEKIVFDFEGYEIIVRDNSSFRFKFDYCRCLYLLNYSPVILDIFGYSRLIYDLSCYKYRCLGGIITRLFKSMMVGFDHVVTDCPFLISLKDESTPKITHIRRFFPRYHPEILYTDHPKKVEGIINVNEAKKMEGRILVFSLSNAAIAGALAKVINAESGSTVVPMTMINVFQE